MMLRRQLLRLCGSVGLLLSLLLLLLSMSGMSLLVLPLMSLMWLLHPSRGLQCR